MVIGGATTDVARLVTVVAGLVVVVCDRAGRVVAVEVVVVVVEVLVGGRRSDLVAGAAMARPAKHAGATAPTRVTASIRRGTTERRRTLCGDGAAASDDAFT